MAKVLLLTVKFESDFQCFVLMSDELRQGNSSELNQDALKELVKCNQHKNS